MKTQSSRPLFALLCAGFLILLFCPAMQAKLPEISTGETVIFSEDFANKANAWISESGNPILDTDGSVWKTSRPESGLNSSVLALKPAINAQLGAVAIYFSMRVDDVAGANNNWVQVRLYENTADSSNRFFGLTIKAGGTGGNISAINARSANGAGLDVRFDQSTNAKFNRATSRGFVTFKLKLTPGATLKDAGVAQAFYYNPETKGYELVGVAEGVSLINGIFDSIKIAARNAEAPADAAYIDSIVITQQ